MSVPNYILETHKKLFFYYQKNIILSFAPKFSNNPHFNFHSFCKLFAHFYLYCNCLFKCILTTFFSHNMWSRKNCIMLTPLYK